MPSMDNLLAELTAERALNESLRKECEFVKKNETQIRTRIEQLKQSKILLGSVIRDLKKQLYLERMQINNLEKEREYVIHRYYSMIDTCTFGACSIIRMTVRNDQLKIRTMRKEILQLEEKIKQSKLQQDYGNNLLHLIGIVKAKNKLLKNKKLFLIGELEKQKSKIASLTEEKNRIRFIQPLQVNGLQPTQFCSDIKIDRWYIAEKLCYADVINTGIQSSTRCSQIPVLKLPQRDTLLSKSNAPFVQMKLKQNQHRNVCSDRTTFAGSKIPLPVCQVHQNGNGASFLKEKSSVNGDSQMNINTLLEFPKSSPFVSNVTSQPSERRSLNKYSILQSSSFKYLSLKNSNTCYIDIPRYSGYNVILEINSKKSASKKQEEYNSFSSLDSRTSQANYQFHNKNNDLDSLADLENDFPSLNKFLNEINAMNRNSSLEKFNPQNIKYGSDITVGCKLVSKFLPRRKVAKPLKTNKKRYFDNFNALDIDLTNGVLEQNNISSNKNINEKYVSAVNSDDGNFDKRKLNASLMKEDTISDDEIKSEIEDLNLSDILDITSEESHLSYPFTCCQSGSFEKVINCFGVCTKTYTSSRDFSTTMTQGKWTQIEDELSFDLSYFTDYKHSYY